MQLIKEFIILILLPTSDIQFFFITEEEALHWEKELNYDNNICSHVIINNCREGLSYEFCEYW